MGCCGQRDKPLDERQKWDYITLSEFKSTSNWDVFSYLWLWILAVIGVAVFIADCYICVNLLAFSKFSSTIEPSIPLKYSKWIFAACIIVSTVLYAYEWQRAVRVMRRNAVAESYMDRIAMQIQCMRGLGWKRFLVFAELTKHRKGADYVALFTYFQFSSAPRIMFAEAGRQVVNGVTLWSLTRQNVIPVKEHAATDGKSPFVQFWENLGAYFQQNVKEAIVFCTMLFTLVIFVISALSLIAAILLYISFLWHYVPQSDGRLSNYCKRKIDKRLTKIVGDKVKAAVSDDSIQSFPTDKFGGDFEKNSFRRQPTLPDLDIKVDPRSPPFGLVRDDTNSSINSFGSKASSPTKSIATLRQQPSLPNIQPAPQRPRFPGRNDTLTSASSYSAKSFESNAPLLRNADHMGYSEPAYPMQPMARGPPGVAIGYGRSSPGPRTHTPGPMRPYTPGAAPPMPHAPPMTRTTTGNTSMTGGPEAYVSAPENRQTLNSTIAELPSGPRSVIGPSRARSVAQTMSTYSTATNGEDSFTRLMAKTSFNRPFVHQDRPNISPVSSAATSTTTLGQNSLVPPALQRKSPEPPMPTRTASRYPSTVVSMAPSAAPSAAPLRSESYLPFNPDSNLGRISSPFSSSNTSSYASQPGGYGLPPRRNMTAPVDQMPAMPAMPQHMLQNQRPQQGQEQSAYPPAPQRRVTDPYANQQHF